MTATSWFTQHHPQYDIPDTSKWPYTIEQLQAMKYPELLEILCPRGSGSHRWFKVPVELFFQIRPDEIEDYDEDEDMESPVEITGTEIDEPYLRQIIMARMESGLCLPAAKDGVMLDG